MDDGRASDCVTLFVPAAARVIEIRARPLAALGLFDLAEAAA